ncbi:hypothetical protein AXG93_2153s1070 [Marchantia polymorpha subsp. ruderalis]|uniref:Uncharacterized protein n=1 Tax=Marchantia polymorpha subsp. ruderalis TaxID=1480154 RepID=A0A176WIS3_MARPO|nr:hypothetical protein AXG93_2153s1070 [Marchantia polymorpha subsp. ruderalis]
MALPLPLPDWWRWDPSVWKRSYGGEQEKQVREEAEAGGGEIEEEDESRKGDEGRKNDCGESKGNLPREEEAAVSGEPPDQRARGEITEKAQRQRRDGTGREVRGGKGEEGWYGMVWCGVVRGLHQEREGKARRVSKQKQEGEEEEKEEEYNRERTERTKESERKE